jgi:RimJ/RimL family protein N-acetyltransferase
MDLTTLEGKTVLLRPLIKEDAKLFVVWFNDPEVKRWLTWRLEEVLSLEVEEKWIEEIQKSETWKVFLIEALVGCAKVKVPIGNCALHDIDWNNQRAGLGVTIGEKEFWSKGYGTEATRLLLDYAFQKLKLHRIESIMLEDNVPAIKALQKAGYTQEGCRRQHVLRYGRFRNVLTFGILSHECKNE